MFSVRDTHLGPTEAFRAQVDAVSAILDTLCNLDSNLVGMVSSRYFTEGDPYVLHLFVEDKTVGLMEETVASLRALCSFPIELEEVGEVAAQSS